MTTSALPCDRSGPGVRISGEILHTYDLIAIAPDVHSVVVSAGGWLCDRARAGWQVTVLLPAGHDARALTILGVRVETVQSVVDTLRGLSAAAVAIDARMLQNDEQVRREVERHLDGGHAEITVWGTSTLSGTDGRFERVRHRLSAAATAFKSHALRATGQRPADPAVEEFLGAALWYPTDGADLAPPTRR
jgi:hypothetical protein